MKIITWVFCEDCFKHDYKYHAVPNFMTAEVKITKPRSPTPCESLMVTFDCLNCKEQGRKHKNKKSLVDMTCVQKKMKWFNLNTINPEQEAEYNRLAALPNSRVEFEYNGRTIIAKIFFT